MAKRLTPEEREQRIKTAIDGRYLLLYQDGEDKATKTKYCLSCLTDGHEWSSTYTNIVNNGRGCPMCSGNIKLTPEEREQRILTAIEGRYLLVGMDGDDKGTHTKYRLRCLVDGHEWSSTYTNIVNNGHGCPCCAGNPRWTPDQREQRINDKIAGKYVLLGQGGEDNRVYTKYRLKCLSDGHEWSATYGSIVNGSGCPACADHGFNPSKPGDFYVNMGIFEGKPFVKYGVTRQIGNKRLEQQKRSAVDIDDYHEIWRESFESGEDALYAERYFDSFTRETIPKENLPDGWTETNTTTPLYIIAMDLIFGHHRPLKRDRNAGTNDCASQQKPEEQSFYDWLESQ